MPKSSKGESSSRPFWSGTISFGLVSIPVDLYPANRNGRASLRTLGPDGVPLRRSYYSQKTGKDLDSDDVVRGYEYRKGKYIVITDEEFERLAPEQSRDIDLRRFVDHDEIRPIFFERAYFLTPSSSSAKAYRLLARTMEESGKAGIATFVMRGKQYIVAILAENGILRAETMRFGDEVRSAADVGLPEMRKPSKAAVHRFEKAISKLSSSRLSSGELSDTYTERLVKLAEGKKRQRHNVVKTGKPGGAENVVDLMEVLKRSLAKKAA